MLECSILFHTLFTMVDAEDISNERIPTLHKPLKNERKIFKHGDYKMSSHLTQKIPRKLSSLNDSFLTH